MNWFHKSRSEVMHEVWQREFVGDLRHSWRNFTWIGRIVVMPIYLAGALTVAVFTSLSFLGFKTIFR